jgi:hypothetical protein
MSAGVFVLALGPFAVVPPGATSRATASVRSAAGATQPLTCAHRGHRVACLRRYGAGDWGGPFNGCAVTVYRDGAWIWSDEGLTGHLVHAAPVKPGTWRVATSGWNGSQGYVVRLSADSWRITDTKSAFVAIAYGPDGPAVGVLLLDWGWDCFPR